MNIYEYHNKPDSLMQYKNRDYLVPQLAYNKAKNNFDLGDELDKKLEHAISKDAKYSFWYAARVLKGRFPLGEAAIAKDAEFSYYYAINVIKGPWPKGEEAIYSNSLIKYQYDKYVVNGENT